MDGRVIVEKLESRALPDALEDSREDYIELAKAYKQINATKGSVGRNSLIAANRAIVGDDKNYKKYLARIGYITEDRTGLASEMIALLNGAAFEHKRLRENEDLIERASELVERVERFAE